MSSDQQSSCSDTVTNHPLPPSQSEGTLMMMYLVVIVCVCVYFSHAVGVQVDRIINESNGIPYYTCHCNE